ncbi:unnamed protein product [Auanema sp. JU1783]|nr:unnamed protein product [Auanema sp. JU1783]
MTSLSKQLEALRTSTSKQLTVDKAHVSLLFDRKEAQTIDRETAFKIGWTGLDQLRKLDPVFEGDFEFFDETALNFQRTLISKEENELLNKRIEKFLFLLMPYMQHFACHQVLEWLIFKYQIYSYNAEMVMAIFLPFHETNVYGRLLSLIDFNFSTSKDWGFLAHFHKNASAVSFNILVKHGLSSGHSLVSRMSRLIDQGIQLVGEEYLEAKGQLLFTFYAKIMLGMLTDNTKIDDTLLSKVIPLVGSGLKSSIMSFRFASLMIICQLSLTVKLASNIVDSIVKILLIKMKESSIDSYLSSLVVLCQQQGVQQFSSKAMLKIFRKEQTLGFWSAVRSLSATTDMLAFLKPLWETLFSIVTSDAYSEEEKDAALHGLLQTGEADVLNGEQASAYLMKIVEETERGFVITSQFKKVLQAVCNRHSNEFNTIVVEWNTRDEKVIRNFLDTCDLNNLLVMFAKESSLKKRNRRRSESIRKSASDEKSEKSKSAYEKADEMAKTSEFTKRQVFSGDPLKKAIKWLKNSDFENLYWALDEMASRKSYFESRLEEEVEDFALNIIQTCVSRSDGTLSSKVKSALSQAKLSELYCVALLSRYDNNEAPSKKARTSQSNMDDIRKAFEGEPREKFEKRQQFVLELLNITPKLPIGAKIINALFEVVKEVDAAADGQQQFFSQQLAIGILCRILSDPGKYKVTVADLQMEYVVEIMRNTHSHHILRDSLKLLTAAVKLDPCSVTSHVMAVFTFMGSGLLRKDNELTLSIIESTLEALFVAVIAPSKNRNRDAIIMQLIGVTRIFASSASDIPAHRRSRMAKAISRAIGVENTWIVTSVLLEGLCAKWQRSATDAGKKAVDNDAFEDIALELCIDMGPSDQLIAIFDLMQFVIRMSGDANSKKESARLDNEIFDRMKYSLPKLRHFRFVIIGLVVKILSQRNLYETLAKCDDNTLYTILLPISKRLMITSVDLDVFIQKECVAIEQNGDPQTVRYWVALQTKAEIISDKLRHLLPGGVAAKLIAEVLQDEKADSQIREKALQLANLKLMQDGYFFSDGGINEEHLVQLASVLNQWIAPHRSKAESILLCQNAAFSLKLVAKRLPVQSESNVLTITMEKCTETASQWQTLDEYMVGNVLLLAGELVRSHNMRCTMLSAEPLLKICLEVLYDCLTSTLKEQTGEEDNNLNKRQRVRQQSLCGRKHGSDTLLICALTCMQRVLDKYSAFITSHVESVVVCFARLCARFWDADGEGGIASILLGNKNNTANNKASIHHRLSLVRSALQQIEPRVLPVQFGGAVVQLIKEEKCLHAVFAVLRGFFTMKNREAVCRIKSELVETVILKALEHRSLVRTPEQFENVCNVELSIFSALVKMVDILSENEIRPFINIIIQWAETGLTSNDINLKVRLITLFSFANHFYQSYNSLATPYFSKLIDIGNAILKQSNASAAVDTTQLIFNGKKHTIEGVEADYLITQVLDFIGNYGRHTHFLSTERAESLIDPLVEELANTKIAGHEKRCVPYLAEALYRVSEATIDTFPELLNKVLMKTRNNRPKIRYRTLLVVEALFDKIGDSIAPHLPLVMPYLSELLEDENENVENQCGKVVQLLQDKFGDNIAEGFA